MGGMAPLTWLAIAASGLVLGQVQNFGTDPDEKKRGEKMISQGERVVAQNEKMVKQQWIAIGIAIVALIISLFALFRH
jgi:heme exporter protein D